MAQNYVFIDYENMKSVDPRIFALERTTITLLLGAQNHSLETRTVQALLHHRATVELVRLEKAGKNAVDFALAYYLGHKTIAEPLTFFHIVSKDKGYDPLIEHLRTRHIKVARHENYNAVIEALKPKVTKPVRAKAAAASQAD